MSLGQHPVRGAVMTNVFEQPLPGTVGVTKTNNSGNSPTFHNFWAAVRDRGTWARHHWIVKADPDCVVIPTRLQAFVQAHSGKGAMYFWNCDRWGPEMFGGMELVSRDALAVYFSRAYECDWMVNGSVGEDYYMDICLHKQLQVKAILDLNTFGDSRCWGNLGCSDGVKLAYHCFKTPTEWLVCWQAASQSNL